MASKAIEELRAKSFQAWRALEKQSADGRFFEQPMDAVPLADAERIVGELEAQIKISDVEIELKHEDQTWLQQRVGELEAQLERRQADLPLACPHCKKLIGYDVEEWHD